MEREIKNQKRFKFLQKLNLDKIRDRVLSKKISRHGGMGIVIIPTLLSVMAAGINYGYVSFAVYLKYQAMVDTYY